LAEFLFGIVYAK